MTGAIRKPLAIVAVVVAAAIVAAFLAGRTAANDGADLADGMVVEAGDGLLYFLWDGGRQRIQQPAGLSDDDLVELGLELGDPAPTLLTLGEEGSVFVVYPYDGPDAALYLADGDLLHKVEVVSASLDDLDERPDLDQLVITRVRVPEVSTR